MKRFLLNVLIFFVVLFAADRLIIGVLQLYRPIDYQQFINAKHALYESDSTYDVLIIGDSHIADAVDTRVLDSIYGGTSFNLGIYHNSPFENYYVLEAALKHLKKKPKIILLGTNPSMFIKPATPGKYTTLIATSLTTKWALYKNAETPIDASLFLKSIQERYLFTSFAKSLLGQQYKPTREIKSIHNGYLESRNQIDGTNWTVFSKYEKHIAPNENQLIYFNRTIELARSQGIQVLIVNTPIWGPYLKAQQADGSFKDFTVTLKKYSTLHNIPIFDEHFQAFESNMEQRDFLNTDHLNYFGAKKFSLKLAGWMKAGAPAHTADVSVR